MKFLTAEDLITAVEKIKYSEDDKNVLSQLLQFIPRPSNRRQSDLLTKTSWELFTGSMFSHRLDKRIYICSYSTTYMIKVKMNANNDVFGAFLAIDKKIGLFNESETVQFIIRNFCFDIWDNSGIIQVLNRLMLVLKLYSKTLQFISKVLLYTGCNVIAPNVIAPNNVIAPLFLG